MANAELREQAERAEQRARELSTLLAVSRSMTSTLEMEPLMGTILDELKRVVDFSAASVRVLDGASLVMLAYRGPNPRSWQRASMPLEFNPLNRAVVERRAPLLIGDTHTDASPAALDYRAAIEWRDPMHAHVRSWLGVPLAVRDQVIGLIVLNHHEPLYYTAHHAELAQAFANHAAVAVDNARLYARAQQAAALEERQRLARELHDAVTQTLFSASLIAEVLPVLWERDATEGRRRVEELRQLTRGALAEMRMLLLELRPAALVETPLRDLLRQLCDAVTGGARVPVTLHVDVELRDGTTSGPRLVLPPEVRVALYRVAQEAMHNMVKHAGATRCDVYWRRRADHVDLRIEDDGVGFDPAAVSAEHLGLRIMRERVAALGATLRVESRPHGGTTVAVHWRAGLATEPDAAAEGAPLPEQRRQPAGVR